MCFLFLLRDFNSQIDRISIFSPHPAQFSFHLSSRTVIWSLCQLQLHSASKLNSAPCEQEVINAHEHTLGLRQSYCATPSASSVELRRRHNAT